MIAFVMSGGGCRAALEAGAQVALYEAGIRPDMVVGTSAGALNAAGLAVNPTLEGARWVASLWSNARKSDFFPGGRLHMLSRLVKGHSLFPSEPLRRFIEREALHDKRTFGDLEGIRLYITTANLNTGTLYLYGDQPGASILDAVMASSALPLAFAPVRRGDWQLVDGAIVANVPIGVAVDKGATEIYILNVGYGGQLVADRSNVLQVLNRAIQIMMYQHFVLDLKYACEQASVTLHHINMTQFQDAGLWDVDLCGEMVKAGQQAAQDYLQNPTGLGDLALTAPGPQVKETPAPPGAEVYTPAWMTPVALLDLPRPERDIVTHLIRRGPSDAEALAQALCREPVEIRNALSGLVGSGQVCLTEDGRVRVVLGRTRSRQLPAEIWSALSPDESCQTPE
jgi:NTE family protein